MQYNLFLQFSYNKILYYFQSINGYEILNTSLKKKFILFYLQMGLGSFCSRKNNDFITLQPKSLRITGTQKGFIQSLEIYQSIQTEEDLDEVSYVFPSDNNLCIYSMKFQVGEETINAELRSNPAAEETFKEAKRAGRTAAKTEKVAPGITAVKIGNVPKNKVVAIIFQCAFMSTLQNPTTILTKIPLQASEPDGSVTDLYNLPSLEINVDLTISHLRPISDVYTNCESNYAKTDDCNGKLTIRSTVITDENILIMTEFKEPVQSQMVQSKNTTSISVIPQFESIKSNSKEYVFLIDCSASMLGESMRKAKESLHLFLSRLPPTSYFNIIRFGTKYDKLFEESSEKVDSNIEKAKTFIDKMRANLGGTEMLSMLEELFKKEVKIGCQRQLFIITDGEVYERQKVIQKVTENRCYNRIFAIGLGHGADAGFLDEITEITHGKSDFVFNRDELPSKVGEQLELSLLEAASETQLHIEGNDSFEAVPYPLPPLLPGVVTQLFVCSEQPVEEVMITAQFKQNSDEIENVIGLKEKWTVNEALDSKSPIYALFAWNQLKRIANDEKKSIALSLSSGVMCDFTSYVAVSENSYVENAAVEEEVCDGMMEMMDECMAECCSFDVASKRIGARLYEAEPMMEDRMEFCSMKSFGGCYEREYECCEEFCKEECIEEAPMKLSKKKKGKKMKMRFSKKKGKKSSIPDDADEDNDDADDADAVDAADSSPESVKPPVEEEIDPSKVWNEEASVSDVIRLQSRDGFWDLPSLFVTKKLEGKPIEVPGVDLSASPIVKKRVVSTVFTLAYLEKFFSDNTGRWRFAKEKAFKWLKRIEASVNWEQVINGVIPSITK